MSLRPCEWCGNPKGYPMRSGDNHTRPDGSVYYCSQVKWECYDCKKRRADDRAIRDDEDHRKLEEIGARFREAEKKKWGLP